MKQKMEVCREKFVVQGNNAIFSEFLLYKFDFSENVVEVSLACELEGNHKYQLMCVLTSHISIANGLKLELRDACSAYDIGFGFHA